GDEELAHRIRVAARAAQPDDVPAVVLDGRGRPRKEHGPLAGLAAFTRQLAVPAQPRRVPVAAAEAPGAAQFPAAGRRDRAARGARGKTPRQHRARIAEYLARGL